MKSARFIAEENDAFYLFTGESGLHRWQHLFFRLSLYFDTQLNWPPGKEVEKSFCLSCLLSSELASSLATLYLWKWFWSCGSIHQELCRDKRLLAFKSRNICQTVKKKKITTFKKFFYLHANLNACGSRDGLGTEFLFFGAHSSSLGLFTMCFHHALGIAGKETLHKY